ncbi:MAG: hydroxyglutarate oxidase [Bdellovibrionales bacterium RIFOXYB1_FULL_37_110]|nr:MAG: hydroxyglutarate oxidase [Bdellovibrionales bacterium RIFOXYC1_FULL_37_79]OFZ58766.1 MAG: hydroxyglutarate oxidase [Bdellovibrionales bacterium RIFOXYB1_FULL_37_110]OFZ64765.1 MAG: hydroxyglutarate oxidase [Bdellovibrionales bacterium RIFOXYD1_FULL_36_51]
MSKKTYDITIIGAGVVGMSVAMQLQKKYPHLKTCVLDKENAVAKHQTGHNSGVIHSGIYYKPGSLKAKNTQVGIKMLHDFCNEQNIKYETCGKLIVAIKNDELPGLDALYKRGIENGIKNLKILNKKEISKIEPHVTAVSAIHVPITGIIDYTEVTKAYKRVYEQHGGVVILNALVNQITKNNNQIEIKTPGYTIISKNLINCAGLYSDHIAKLAGTDPGLKIIPFRGEYYKLNAKKNNLVNHLIYPIPNPEFPFLGVHFTRMMDGVREVGPNAVFAFKREGYHKFSFSLKDTLENLTYPSFWKMGIKYWKMGLKELSMSLCKPLFLQAVREMIPDINLNDLTPSEAGVRAQALEPGGILVDDFRFVQSNNFLHVLNAPSPAATASLAIGKQILEKVEINFGLG